MPRPKRDGNWKKESLTLSEDMRRAVAGRAAQWGTEKGAAADRLLRLGEETQRALEAPGTPELTNRAALWTRLNRLFLDEVMDHLERNFAMEELAGIVGQEHAESHDMNPGPAEWEASGAFEIIGWLRLGRISAKWKRRVYDYLDVVWTFHPSVLRAGVTLDQFLDEG